MRFFHRSDGKPHRLFFSSGRVGEARNFPWGKSGERFPENRFPAQEFLR